MIERNVLKFERYYKGVEEKMGYMNLRCGRYSIKFSFNISSWTLAILVFVFFFFRSMLFNEAYNG
jgi:hypothetical protein